MRYGFTRLRAHIPRAPSIYNRDAIHDRYTVSVQAYITDIAYRYHGIKLVTVRVYTVRFTL